MTIILDGTAGIANNATDLSYTGTLTGSTGVVNIGSGQVYKDASGNVGIGTVPSAWGSGTSVIDLNTSGSAAAVSSSGTISIANNGYFNGTNWIYKNSSTALTYQLISGQHRWNIAASGTAGNAITFTQAMTLDSSGNLLVGKTAVSSSKFEVAAAAEVASFQNTGGTGTVRFYNSAASTIGYIQWSGSTTSYVTGSYIPVN